MNAALQHKRNIARKFNRAVTTYDQTADLQYQVGERLLAQIKPFNLAPQYVLDLGIGTGQLTKELIEYYPQSKVIGLDIADQMLALSAQRLDQKYLICADFDNLPFGSACFDLIFSNMSLQWSFNLMATVEQALGCLQRNGLMAVTLLVDDTLHELSEWLTRLTGRSKVNPCYSSKRITAAFAKNLVFSDLYSYQKEFASMHELLLFLRRTGASYSLTGSSQNISIWPLLHTAEKKISATFTVLTLLLKV